MSQNLERLKEAFACWGDRKGDSAAIDKWMELFGERCMFRTLGDGRAGIEFSKLAQTKEEVRGFFESLTSALRMLHYTPHFFIEQGDRIAALATTAWTNPVSGESAEFLISTFWRFEGDKVVEFYQLYDTGEIQRVLASRAG